MLRNFVDSVIALIDMTAGLPEAAIKLPTHKERLEAIELPLDRIPEEYLDRITFEIMDNPIILDMLEKPNEAHDHIIDQVTLHKLKKNNEGKIINPFTNNPIQLEKIDEKLKQEIETFVTEQEKRVRHIEEQQRQKKEKDQEQAKNLEQRRKELAERISTLVNNQERNLNRSDEEQLKKLMQEFDALDAGNNANNPREIMRRIEFLLEQQEENGPSQENEKKLNKLLRKIDVEGQGRVGLGFFFRSSIRNESAGTGESCASFPSPLLQ